jgi:hypothetical protein
MQTTMNKTNEIEFVPKRSDGWVKAIPTRTRSVDKATPPGGPILGNAKKVTPKKHPPRITSSGAAASVDKKISKISYHGQHVERSSCHERLERSKSEEPTSTVNKPPKKHPPSREASLVRETRGLKGTIAETGTNVSTIPKKYPLREFSWDPVEKKKDSNAEGTDSSCFKTPRRRSQEPSKDHAPLKDTDPKMSKPCVRRSVERKFSRQNSCDRVQKRSTERKHSAPPVTNRGRTRSTERTKPTERKTSKEPILGMARTRSPERKLSRQNSKDNTIPKPVDQEHSKERNQPKLAERKILPIMQTNNRPKSEELVPYKAPIKCQNKGRTRSKSADRVTGKYSTGNTGPSRSKAAPQNLKLDEAPLKQTVKKGIHNSNGNGELPVQNDKVAGPEIIELSKQSTNSKDETIATTVEDASCCNNSTSCTDGNSEDIGKFLTRHVSFGNVDVQEFAYSLGSDVVSRDGPPVSIAHSPLRSRRFDVDAFEKDRSLNRRDRGDLRLSEVDRIIILQRCGYSAEDIEQACWDAEKVRKQRLKSIKNKDWDGWNAASESLARKIAKISSAKDLLFGSS